MDKSNRFSLMNKLKKRQIKQCTIKTPNGPEKPLKPLCPLGARGPSSNTPMFGLTPLITPNGSSITSHTFAQFSNKIPIHYNGMPHVHPKTDPFHGAVASSNYLRHSWTHPTHHPNTIQIQLTVFPHCTGQTDRQTDRPMNRLTDR